MTRPPTTSPSPPVSPPGDPAEVLPTADAPTGKLTDRILTGAAALTAGQVVTQIAVFLRSVIVVRTLSKVDWGIASTFALSIQFVEMSANMNVERLLIQASDGDEARFQRSAQFLRCAQGLLVATVLFLLAPFLADLFSVPEAAWAYQLLALAPLANAFTHFDPQRFTRALRYGPNAIAQAGGQVAALVLVIILSFFVSDYRLVLYTLLFQPLAQAALTHLVADRRYGWACDKGYLKRLFAFGWPLTLNGFLMYFVVQGDRFLIGSAQTIIDAARAWFEPLVTAVQVYDKADLAVYATAFGLCWMPTQFLTRTFGALAFPILSRVHDQPAEFERKFRMTAGVFSVFATLMASGMVLGGTAATVLFYKEDYRSVQSVIGLLGAMQALRILRTAPTMGALAVADSKILLYANVGRATAFIGGLAATLSGADLAWIAAAGVAAEVLATTISMAALRWRHGVPAASMLRPGIFAIVGIGIAFVLAGSGWWANDAVSLVVTALYLLLLLGAAWIFFPDAAPAVREMLASRRARKNGDS